MHRQSQPGTLINTISQTLRASSASCLTSSHVPNVRSFSTQRRWDRRSRPPEGITNTPRECTTDLQAQRNRPAVVFACGGQAIHRDDSIAILDAGLRRTGLQLEVLDNTTIVQRASRETRECRALVSAPANEPGLQPKLTTSLLPQTRSNRMGNLSESANAWYLQTRLFQWFVRFDLFETA